MVKPETIKDLLIGGHISEGDVRKIAVALWEADSIATEAFPAPYRLTLPDFESLPEHVQGFIVKGLLDAEIEPQFKPKFKPHPWTGEPELVDVPVEPFSSEN